MSDHASVHQGIVGTHLSLLVLLLVSGPAVAASQAAPANEACTLSDADARWAQRVVDDWDVITTEILGLPATPLPWTILYDDTCTWQVEADPAEPLDGATLSTALHYHGRAVAVRGVPHAEVVDLPGDSEIPVQPRAFTSLYSPDGTRQRPFFVLATASLWRQEVPAFRDDPRLEDFFLGVAGHEMTHTLQLVAVDRQIEALRKELDLPEDLSDTSPEERFAEAPGYQAALDDELSRFLDAAASTDRASRRRLARSALLELDERRRRYFTLADGTDGGWGQLEDIFLGLEGAAVWTHFTLAGAGTGVAFLPDHPEATTRTDVLTALRARGSGEWVQDEGFLLYLLIDDFVPDWKHAAFGPDPPSPIRVLEDALDDERGSARPE